MQAAGERRSRKSSRDLGDAPLLPATSPLRPQERLAAGLPSQAAPSPGLQEREFAGQKGPLFGEDCLFEPRDHHLHPDDDDLLVPPSNIASARLFACLSSMVQTSLI